AALTEAKAPLEIEDITAYAMMAERMFQLPLFYLEYSGVYGDLAAVKAVRQTLEKTVFFYGGGITGPEQAKEIAQYADVIVVGNAVYENLNKALQTVAAVKNRI
ncbi:MAG TPA: geranylgeranylglyceryl/heptaprenylglyceryl phosphate synthase, partial [Pseudobacillus sp.]